jgi:UDP:flavonoid glycosyltransferase YjiC (YdhE family)
MGKRIVLTTFGSLGDLHPMIGLAKGLQARGHEPIIATTPEYRPNVEAEGIAFFPVRPNANEWFENKEIYRQIMDTKEGTAFLLRELVLPYLEESYQDMWQVTEGADLVVTNPLTLSALVVAEVRKMPWISVVLAPASFISAYDFPLTESLPGVGLIRRMGTGVTGLILKKAKSILEPLLEPYYRFREIKGLARGKNPFLGGQFSPHKTLALYSPLLGKIEPDYPPNTVITGFIVHDRRCAEKMPTEVSEFLNGGAAPLVFTLGSAASMAAGSFYERSVEIAYRMNRRAIFLIGKDKENMPKQPLSDKMLVAEYAPYSELFPRASALITSGGIGTSGQIMRSGRPAIIVPHGHDQWDNGDRLRRLGVARVVMQKDYRTLHGAAEIFRLISEKELYPRNSERIAEAICKENGLQVACDEIEKVIREQSV